MNCILRITLNMQCFARVWISDSFFNLFIHFTLSNTVFGPLLKGFGYYTKDTVGYCVKDSVKYFVFQMEPEISKTGCVSVPMAPSCLLSWAYYK